jgi:DNA recombination-dependent growth factor C
MQDPAAAKSSVQWLDMDLTGEPARRQLQDGLKLLRLGVDFDGVLSCVLDLDGVLRKLRVPEGDAAEVGDEEELARLDAEFVMATGSVRRLLETLRKQLDGYA